MLGMEIGGVKASTCYLQVGPSCFNTGRRLLPFTRLPLKRKAAYVAPKAAAATAPAPAIAVTESSDKSERFRLNNLSPQKGARRQEKRKGRGYGAGQVGVHTLTVAI